MSSLIIKTKAKSRREHDVLTVSINGRLRCKDYEVLEKQLNDSFDKKRQVHLLIDTTFWTGTEFRTIFQELSMAIKQFRKISRLAIVGKSQFARVLTLVSKPWVKDGDARYFHTNSGKDALNWLVA